MPLAKQPLIEMTLTDIAERIGGEVSGSGDTLLSGAAPFEMAGPREITFADQPAYLKKIDQTRAGAVLVPPQFNQGQKPMVRVPHPKTAFARLLKVFYPPKKRPAGIHPRAVIGDNVSWGQDISIGPGVVIEGDVILGDRVTLHPNVVIQTGVTIGDDVELFPNVSILEGCEIGSRVTIHASTVIGSDGFGFAPDGEAYVKILQRGIVRIDDDVEIGAGCTIDRATHGKTWIKSGVKTDNLVHIAHNVTVGQNTLLIAQVGISGSCTIGRHAILAGQAGVADHLTVGDNTIVGAQSGLAQSVPADQVVFGSPPLPHRKWLRVQSVIPRLPEMRKTLNELKKRLEKIELREHRGGHGKID